MSSRQNRADKSVLGPEDFMDEEVGVQNYNQHFASGMWVGGCCSTFSLPRKSSVRSPHCKILSFWYLDFIVPCMQRRIGLILLVNAGCRHLVFGASHQFAENTSLK